MRQNIARAFDFSVSLTTGRINSMSSYFSETQAVLYLEIASAKQINTTKNRNVFLHCLLGLRCFEINGKANITHAVKTTAGMNLCYIISFFKGLKYIISSKM